MKDKLKGNRIAKVTSLLATMVMPLYFLTMFVVILITGDFDTAISHLWQKWLCKDTALEYTVRESSRAPIKEDLMKRTLTMEGFN